MFSSEKIKKLESDILGMKMELKNIQAEVTETAGKSSNFTGFKACSNCGIVKLRRKFVDRPIVTYNPTHASIPIHRDYCDECVETVEERNKAVKLAEENPKKVIKCFKGK